MILKKKIKLVICAFVVVCGVHASHSQETDKSYFARPPEISVPDGEAGKIRRAIMQFNNWTLICDEDIPAKKQVCNVTQAIVDAKKNVVFSWSLAASNDGQPFFLLRTLPVADKNKPVQIFFPNLKDPINANYIDCNQSLCLAQIKVGAILSAQISTGSLAFISYSLKNGNKFQFYAPLNGLKEAVQSIK